jgi:hypothetical protein
MYCKSCGSVVQKKFSAEMATHFPELKNIDMPVMWLFPEIVVCLDCGIAEFAVPKAELRQIATGDVAVACCRPDLSTMTVTDLLSVD